MSVQEIEAAIQQLPPAELAKLAVWFEAHRAEESGYHAAPHAALLQGSVRQFDHPFEPAVDAEDWDAA